MITIILNIIGLILIIYSIYIIRKDLANNKGVISDLNLIEKRVKEYYNLTEEIIEGFDEIIDSKLEMINTENEIIDNKKIYHRSNHDNSFVDYNSLDTGNINLNSFHKKVIELKKIGLTNEEIAKKLNKGVREIEIILKMYGDKK